MNPRVWLLVATVCVPLVAYPLFAVASGAPRFPTRDECSRPATTDAPDLDVVYGRLDGPAEADELLASLDAVGFIGAKSEFDACGRWKVFYDGIESRAQGEGRANKVGDGGVEARVVHGG